MATTGPLHTFWGKKESRARATSHPFPRTSETASAGYYAVTLDDYKIRAEATAAPHSGMLRFTFPQNDQSRIQIDLSHRQRWHVTHQTVKVTDDHTIEGTIDCPGRAAAGVSGHTSYTLYYHLEFSKPFTKVGVWSATLPPIWSDTQAALWQRQEHQRCPVYRRLPERRDHSGLPEKEGQHLGFYSEFPTKADEVVMVKAGISFASIDGARANLAAEIPDWNFDRVHQQARDSWVKAFDHLSVEGGTEDHKTIFYSALYRALLFPQTFADVDGSYPGGDHKPHQSSTFVNRTLFSGWDDYRSVYPLLTLVAPSVVNDQINSMVNLADFNGTHYYDRWEIMGCYTGS